MANRIPRHATLIGDIETDNAKISLYENLEIIGPTKKLFWYVKLVYSDEWLAKLDRTSSEVRLSEKVEVKRTDSLTKIQETIAELKQMPNYKYTEYQKPTVE